MARRRYAPRQPALVIRRITAAMANGPFQAGQTVVGRQTRQLEMLDWVLVVEDDQEYIALIERHQGDLIYLISRYEGDQPKWLHAKYIVAKIIWPKIT